MIDLESFKIGYGGEMVEIHNILYVIITVVIYDSWENMQILEKQIVKALA